MGAVKWTIDARFAGGGRDDSLGLFFNLYIDILYERRVFSFFMAAGETGVSFRISLLRDPLFEHIYRFTNPHGRLCLCVASALHNNILAAGESRCGHTFGNVIRIGYLNTNKA